MSLNQPATNPLPPFVPYEAKTSLIHISSYDDQNLCGSWYNISLEAEQQFGSTTQLLLQIEQLLDELSFPQRAMNERFFDQPASARATVSVAGAAETRPACLASFKINVIFRQNATWQGALVWLEPGREANFRSVLELIKLIDSALSETVK